MKPLVVVDADVLGRERTGDETYVLNLLRELSPLAPEAGLRIAAVTRRIDLVPAGIEPVELATPSQELRMTLMLPRLLRGLGAALGHFQYALPLVLPCPAVVTIHDQHRLAQVRHANPVDPDLHRGGRRLQVCEWRRRHGLPR